MRRTLSASAVALAACAVIDGLGGGNTVSAPVGSVTATGVLGGSSFSAVSAFSNDVPSGGRTLVTMTSTPMGCGSAPPSGTRLVQIALLQNGGAPSATGTYVVGGSGSLVAQPIYVSVNQACDAGGCADQCQGGDDFTGGGLEVETHDAEVPFP